MPYSDSHQTFVFSKFVDFDVFVVFGVFFFFIGVLFVFDLRELARTLNTLAHWHADSAGNRRKDRQRCCCLVQGK